MSDTHTCRICGITCPHVQASGAWWCPNCLDEHGHRIDYWTGRVGSGCKICGLHPRSQLQYDIRRDYRHTNADLLGVEKEKETKRG